MEPEGTPETIDWNRFLGSAPQRAFSPDRYFRWRKYWDYSGGIATDLFYHSLSPLVKVMGRSSPPGSRRRAASMCTRTAKSPTPTRP